MNRKLILIIGGILTASLGYYFWSSNQNNTGISSSESDNYKDNRPTFVKEGEVVFLKKDTDEVIKKIEVEIADNDAERAKGWMFRAEMPDSIGMLFIFEESEPQAFWMKNTLISLDIIYVNEKKQIVSIQKNAKPYSEESLPSNGNAQYVIEVNGGWCDKYGIGAGDVVRF